MIKVDVMYPHREGARFDHAYYRDSHLPMVAEKLGDALKGFGIDRGLAGGAPGSPPPYVAKCALYFDSVEAFQSGMARHGRAMMADVANYTDIAPVMQVSEVVAK